MGIVKTFKHFIGFDGKGEEDEYYDDKDYDETEDDEEDEEEQPQSSYQRFSQAKARSQRTSAAKVVNVRADRGSDSDGSAEYPTRTIKVFKPLNVNDTRKIADEMKKGRVVILNVENADGAEKQRIVDCIYGVSYGLNFHFKRVADRMFVASPHNIEITGDGIKIQDGEVYHW